MAGTFPVSPAVTLEYSWLVGKEKPFKLVSGHWFILDKKQVLNLRSGMLKILG